LTRRSLSAVPVRCRVRRGKHRFPGHRVKEAGAEGLTFELLNRNVDQPYKFNATWVIDEWSKIGVKVTQRVLPTGPFAEALRQGEFDTALDGECQNIVNPLLDGTKYLPHTVSSSNFGNYEEPAEIELYDPHAAGNGFRAAVS
jgi:peptide/nickel transport system substrate-binding protein